MTRTLPPLTAIQRRLLALVALTCLVFAIVTPPFQAPDEPQHLSRAVRLARGQILPERVGGATGGIVPLGYARLSVVHFPREAFGQPVRYTLAEIRDALTARPDDLAETFIEFANVADYAPTLYAPQAVGVRLGETMGLAPLANFYLARLVNAGAFLLLLGLAVRVAPFGRAPLLAVAALPTVAYQGGSVSPDATINGLGWLAVALSLRVGWHAVGRGGLLATAVPLGLSKGLYAPLLLAGAGRRGWRWPVAAFIVAALAFVAWTLAAGGDQSVYIVESRTTGQLVTTAPLSDQLRFVLGDPLGYVRTLASSMAERAPVYALQLGGRFGWNAILLPLLAYLLMAVMIGAGIASGLGTRAAAGQRLWWAAVGTGVILLVETALYLTGTPLGADYVQGTQGRYFLPALPLLAMAVAPVGGVRHAPRILWYAALTLNLAAVATVVDAFWVHGFTNVRGLPSSTGDAAGLLRMLFLPSPRWG